MLPLPGRPSAPSSPAPAGALHELHTTEATYVNDLTLLCECLRNVHATRASKANESRLWATLGADAETLLQIHLELLRLLRCGPADVDYAATAFGTMAPYMRVYSQYCSNYVTAQERLEKLRGESGLDKALMSLLIKPVQRLCKYPLLLDGLLFKLPSEHPSRGALEAAAAAVKSIAEQVNERVRLADGRARFVACANALNQPELVTPGRHLLREVDVLAQVVASGLGTSRGGKHKCRLWIASDLLILAKVVTRMGSTSYSVLQQGALCHAVLTAAPATDAGQASLRLTSRESRVTSLVWLTTAAEAESLLGLFEKAREKAASSASASRARALDLIEQRNGVLAELLRARPRLADSGQSSHSSIESERSGKSEAVSKPALMPWGWYRPRRSTKGTGDADDGPDTEGRVTNMSRASSGGSSALVLAQPLEDLAPALAVYGQSTARPGAGRGGGGAEAAEAVAPEPWTAAEAVAPESGVVPPPISVAPDGEDGEVEEEQTPPCGSPSQRLAQDAGEDFKREVVGAVRRLSFASSTEARLPAVLSVDAGAPLSGASQAPELQGGSTPELQGGSTVKKLCSHFSNLEFDASCLRCFCRVAGSSQSGGGGG